MERKNTERIGNVILNYKFYNNSDVYSDGDEVEDTILNSVKEKSNRHRFV